MCYIQKQKSIPKKIEPIVEKPKVLPSPPLKKIQKTKPKKKPKKKIIKRKLNLN